MTPLIRRAVKDEKCVKDSDLDACIKDIKDDLNCGYNGWLALALINGVDRV